MPPPDASLDQLLAALPDLAEYGTATVRSKGQITIPTEMRSALRLEDSKYLFLWGSPSLRLALILGQTLAPHDHFRARVSGLPELRDDG